MKSWRTIKGLGSIFLALFFLLSASPAFALHAGKVLIIQLSDTHSRTDRIPLALAMIRKRIAEFRAVQEDGEVIILAGGDMVARGPWSVDQGWADVKLLRHLGRDFPVSWTLGNHEALDWREDEGRRLYLNHLKEVVKQGDNPKPDTGVRILVANLKPATALEGLIQGYRDIPILGGTKTLRVAGFTIDDFFKQAVYDFQIEPALFVDSSPLEVELRRQMISAADTKVDWLVPVFHQEASDLEALSVTMRTWMNSTPKLSRLKVPLLFAADDHLEVNKDTEGFRLVDSGSQYTFSSVELTASGQVFSHQLHRPKDISRKDREHIFNHLTKSDRLEFLNPHVTPIIRKQRHHLETGTNVEYQTDETRFDAKAHRTELGTILCDSTRLYVEDLIRGRLPIENKVKIPVAGAENVPVVSFNNSSSIRNEDGIKGPQITVGDVEALNPFMQTPGIYILTGKEVQELYSLLRAARATAGVYSPQMSSNLEEVPGTEHQLMYLPPKRKENAGNEVDSTPVPISQIPRVVVVLDHFLAENGYHTKGVWTHLLAKDSIKSVRFERDIILEYVGRAVYRMRARNRAAKKSLESLLPAVPTESILNACSSELRLFPSPQPDSAAG